MTIINYPKFKIILCYCIFGGSVGGLIIGWCLVLLITLQDIFINDFNLNDFFELGAMAFLVAFVGFFVGFLPALVSALIIVKKRLNLSMQKVYKQLFMIGFLSTFIPVCLYVLVYGIYLLIRLGINPESLSFMIKKYFSINSIDNVLGTLIICIISGISAMICGKLFLPKGFGK